MVAKVRKFTKMNKRFGERADISISKSLALCIIIAMVLTSLSILISPSSVVGEGSEDIEPNWKFNTGDKMQSTSMTPNGLYVVASSYNHVYLFSRDDPEPIWTYTGTTDIKRVDISNDGNYIVASSRDSDVYLFGKSDSDPIWRYNTGDWADAVAISGNGEYIIAGSNDHNVYFFSRESSTPLWQYDTGEYVRQVAISENGDHIVVGNGRGVDTIYLFDRAFTGSAPIWSYATGSDVWAVDISADGEMIAAGNNDGDGKIFVFKRSSSEPLWTKNVGIGLRVAISADGNFLIAATNGHETQFYSTESSTPLWIHTADDIVRWAAISADGSYGVSGSMDDSVYYFDREYSDSKPLWEYATGENILRPVSMSSDGNFISVPSDDHFLYLLQRKQLLVIPDSPSFEAGDTASFGIHYFNGSSNVSYQVTDPKDDTYLIKTVETNDAGYKEIQFALGEDVELGTWTIHATNDKDNFTEMVTFDVTDPVIIPITPHIMITDFELPDSVSRGDATDVDVTVENTHYTAISLTIVLQLEDEDLIPIPPVIIDEIITGNTTEIFTVQFTIPEDSDSGTYSGQMQIMTDVPESGGYTYDFLDDTTSVS